ncbi:uncharacterized protein LOC116846867 [Odontomachus brunneus]|uniref:uncharacterized protein LOC116846867 n=1 Tax=Odontomachus brunneus TaxID=486640 RepID=UPI0013F1D94B|nr:uncharacterized protein LOC116846867 [Odontomachus brunneus]
MAEYMAEDMEKDMEEETDKLLPPLSHYNNFFHPNLCHVCKSTDQCKLSRCMKCEMIFYCSEEHRLLDQKEHIEICQAIENVIKQRNIWNSRNMGLTQWAQFRLLNMNALQSMVQRTLKIYEKEIFLNPKSCYICREQQNLVEICHECKSINMCPDHISVRNNHDCQMRRRLLAINMFVAATDEDERIPEKLLYFKENINDMKSFIAESLNHSGIWPLEFYIYSEYFSRPLTLFYGMKQICKFPNLSKLPMHDTFVIHIIDEHFKEFLFIDIQLVHYLKRMQLNTLSAWEIILHKFPYIKNLIIIMIKPGLFDNAVNIKLCDVCRRKQKSLCYRYISKEYHEYTKSPGYMKPNVIIRYDGELKINQKTILNLRAMQREYCPLLLASSSEIMTQDNILNIQEMLDLQLTPIFNNKNKFKTYRPVKDYINDSVFVPQQYLIVYKNLYSSN